MKNNHIVNLAGTEPFAAGLTRQCYIHPHDSDTCIKILLVPGTRKHRSTQQKQVYRLSSFYLLRRFTKYLSDANLNEWQGHLHARSMREAWVWNHVPRCYDFVETDLGLGLVVELLRHDNGDIATPLSKRLRSSGADDSFWDAWAELKEFILKSGFYTRSLSNILSVNRNGKEHLYFAEPKWRRPGLTWIPYFRRKRLLRKIAKMEKEIARHSRK